MYTFCIQLLLYNILLSYSFPIYQLNISWSKQIMKIIKKINGSQFQSAGAEVFLNTHFSHKVKLLLRKRTGYI